MPSQLASDDTLGSARRGMSLVELLRIVIACAMVVITAATVCTQVFSTLAINRVAPIDESDAMRTLQLLFPGFVVAGLICGAISGGAMMFLAWKQIREKRFSAAVVWAVAAVAVCGSVVPLAAGAWAAVMAVWGQGVQQAAGFWESIKPEGTGQSGSPQCQWAMISLTVAWAAWAISGFQDRSARTTTGTWLIGARRFDDCMTRVRLSRVAMCIPMMILVAGLASMLISAAETQFHTFDVAQRITESTFQERGPAENVEWETDVDVLPICGYWRVSLSAAWLVGSVHGIIFGMIGVIVFGLYKWLRKRYQSPGLGANILGLIAGVYIFIYGRHGLAWVFEDEITELRMFVLATLGTAIVGIIYGSLVAWNITELCSRDDRPRNNKDMMRVILLSGILLGIGPVARLGRRGCAIIRALVALGLLVWSVWVWPWGPLPLAVIAGAIAVFECIVLLWRKVHVRRSVFGDISAIAVACAIAAGIVSFMFIASFPETEDHTTRAAVFLALIITVVTVYSACLLLPPGSRAWALYSVVVGVLLVGGSASMISVMTVSKDHSTIRNIMYEHSAVSKNNLECWQRVYGSGWKLPPPCPPVVTPPDAPVNSPILDGFRKEKPLVIFIIWDACRPDHMSFHGYHRKTTPVLDSMKDRLIRFDTAFSQATGTSCSMRHVFTGRYSSRYMLKKTGIGPFFTNEILAGGYHTLHLNIVGSDYNGISGVAFLRDMPEDLQARVKVQQSGEHLKEVFKKDPMKNWMAKAKKLRAQAGGLKPDRRVICYGEQKPDNKVTVLLDYLDNNKAEGTFAYMHMVETHFPWVRREGSPNWGDRQEDRYDSSIAYTDRATGKLFDGLKKRGLLDKAIIIISADHGTGLGDHGKYAGFHPYYEQIHIPLIMHIPGVKGKVVKSLVGLFDIAPMLVNMAAPELVEARNYEAMDLWPLILRGERKAPRVIFGLNSFEECYYRIGSDQLHYILRKARKYDDLFNYVKDPHERTRKLLGDTEAVKKCAAEMSWFLSRGKGRYLDPLHYRAEDPTEE
ncbi:MAG: sulfatase-like hydrolase/transferase [bacterium]|nr:sulfatase-like hydrolase/transferase [bacterium]